ncbi:MAG: HdeD family acid-resistance protein [Candidatus Ventricola sp.]
MKYAKKPASAFRELHLSFSLAAVVYLLLGLLMIVAPNTSRRLLCTLVGVGIMVYGLLSIVPFLMSKGEKRFTFDLLIGICALAFGLFSLINRTFLMDFLFTALGVVVCVTSVCGVSRALNLRYYGFARWWAPLCANLATLVLALCVIFFPGFFGNMLMVAMGVILVVEAVSDLISIHYLGRFAKRVSASYNVGD